MPGAAALAAGHDLVEGQKQKLRVLRRHHIHRAFAPRSGHEHIPHQGPGPVGRHQQVLSRGVDGLRPQGAGEDQGAGVDGVAHVPHHGVLFVVLLPGIQAAQHPVDLLRLYAGKQPRPVDHGTLPLVHSLTSFCC